MGSIGDPRILVLLGMCAGALGAVTVFSYPGLSQVYYLKSAAGAFGLLSAAGLAALLPERPGYGPLLAWVTVTAAVGGAAVLVIRALGPGDIPTLARSHLFGVMLATVLPVLALVGVAVVAYFLLARLAPERPVLHGAAPLLITALVMGFSLPRVVTLLVTPIDAPPVAGEPIPADGIAAARWLRDHSDPSDLVATNLHCVGQPQASTTCDARHFWVSGFAERRVLVEGWAYTTRATAYGVEHGVSDRTVPFWDQSLLAANDAAFTTPSVAALATLRDLYGVRWLFANLNGAGSEAIGRLADLAVLRDREGSFAVYELRRP
jgi:hypothetical protein